MKNKQTNLIIIIVVLIIIILLMLSYLIKIIVDKNNNYNNQSNNNSYVDKENDINNNQNNEQDNIINDKENDNTDNEQNNNNNNDDDNNDKENNQDNEQNKDNQNILAPKVTYNAYFKSNGATYLEKEKITCEVINNQCLITMPNAKRENGTVIGYNTTSTSKNVLYTINQQINLTKDITFYVISSEKYNLQIIDNNIDYLSHKNTSCIVYNNETSCNITLPFYNKKGYEVRGYSDNPNVLVGTLYPNTKYTLKTSNTILYPIISTASRKKAVSTINKVLFVDDMIIDVDGTCSETTTNTLLTYLKNTITYAPFLSIGSKISFLGNSTYNSIWGTDSAGMSFGSNRLRSIDIRCPSNTDRYYSIFPHEMAHALDLYYANFFDNAIYKQNDIIDLYNKYKDDKNRPFRDASYKNVKEFFADMVMYYYLKYLDPSTVNIYKNTTYPDDIKQVLEKYICIANNNYNDKSC